MTRRTRRDGAYVVHEGGRRLIMEQAPGDFATVKDDAWPEDLSQWLKVAGPPIKAKAVTLHTIDGSDDRPVVEWGGISWVVP